MYCELTIVLEIQKAYYYSPVHIDLITIQRLIIFILRQTVLTEIRYLGNDFYYVTIWYFSTILKMCLVKMI